MADIRVLVTGSGGFVGQAVCSALRSRSIDVVALKHSDLDICDATAVTAAMQRFRPMWVVHCAALASTAYCREHPDESMAVNVEGTLNVARAAHAVGARLVYCSSDQVYSGCTTEGPLSEDLQLQPNHPYGAHKLLMEQLVQAETPSAIALRLTWMYDAQNDGRRHGVCSSLAQAAAQGTAMKACTREHRGMTHVGDVAAGICSIIERNIPGGVYNFGSPNSLTTFDTLVAATANRRAEAPEAMPYIEPDDSWSRNLAMDIARISSLGITFPPTAERLAEFVGRL